MRLYEVAEKSWVKIVPDPKVITQVPPDAPPLSDGEVIFFYHIDGMYSLCRKQDGTLCHLVAWQEVEKVGAPVGNKVDALNDLGGAQ
jgi:hypothetical protein